MSGELVPRASVTTPDATPISLLARQAVLALDSPSSQRNYHREITSFLASGASLTRSSVLGYVQGLKNAKKGASGIRVALAAIRLLAREANERSLVDDATLASLDTIRAPKVQGVRLGNWLTLDQCRDLLEVGAAGSSSPTRDKALIACMLGCGLRRDELSRLTREQYQVRAGRPVWVNVGGKGNKSRSVPVCRWAATLIEQWLEEASNKDSRARVFPMTAQNIYLITGQCASRAGLAGIAPHDLRRTFARRLYEAGADLEQLRQVLGHSSLQVTMRYVGAGVELAPGKAVVDLFELPDTSPAT